MVKDINYLLMENEKLMEERDTLHKKLDEAKEVIEAIKKGNIDAVFMAHKDTPKVLVLSAADQSYRTFIENMSEGVITLNTDGTILYSNSSFANIIDLPLEQVIGINFRNFIPIEYKGSFEWLFSEFPEANSKVEISIVNQKGTRTYFIVSINKLQLQDTEAINLVWTDVTYQKKAEEKLIILNENLNRAIERQRYSENKVVVLNGKLQGNIKILEDANVELATFAHIASHDLQEPLRKIITYSSILIHDYYNVIDEQGQTYINNMQSASERMRNLINDILEYSGLSHKDFLYTPTNLDLIVKEIINNLEIVINETQAKIIIEKKLPVVEANAGQMRQLFQNLISNSLKFIKAGTIPEISISYKIIKGNEIAESGAGMLNEDYYAFFVKDNGIGFNPLYKNKIFTIFQRLNNNSVYKGTGIGLAICKKIVEQHNGFISAASELHEGAQFTIILPVSRKKIL